MKIPVLVPKARINKGYNGSAIAINDQGTFAHFQVGVPTYDAKAESKTIWVNLQCRVVNKKIIERLQKLNLGEGSFIDLSLTLAGNQYQKDGKTKTDLVFNVEDFDLPKASNPANNQNNGGYQQTPAQNNGYVPQNNQQYAGQPNGYAPNPTGFIPPNANFNQVNNNQGGGMPQGFTVVPQGPTNPPANACVTPVGTGFTGYEGANNVMGFPNGGMGFTEG